MGVPKSGLTWMNARLSRPRPLSSQRSQNSSRRSRSGDRSEESWRLAARPLAEARLAAWLAPRSGFAFVAAGLLLLRGVPAAGPVAQLPAAARGVLGWIASSAVGRLTAARGGSDAGQGTDRGRRLLVRCLVGFGALGGSWQWSPSSDGPGAERGSDRTSPWLAAPGRSGAAAGRSGSRGPARPRARRGPTCGCSCVRPRSSETWWRSAGDG